MLDQWLTKIRQIPSLLLGFLVIVGVLIFLYFNDPPKTICDVQMNEVNQRLVKGFFKDDTRGGGFEAGIMTVFNHCLTSNSPGGCYDIFSRLDYLEGLIKTVPSQCGGHEATASLKGYLEKGLRLIAKIAWGEKKPINKYNKTAWLDMADLGLYCRLKRQYVRLYGNNQWQSFAWSVLPTLPESKGLTKKEVWELCLFSYPCKGLY